MKLKPILLAVAGFAASIASAADASEAVGPACSKAAVESAVRASREARAELAAERADEDETLVPPRTRRLIEQAKDRMRDYVRAEMACAPPSAEPKALNSAMRTRGGYFPLHRTPAGPDEGPREPHGDRMLYEVSAVPGHPRMLAVVASLGIRCGTDSMLLLYRHSGGGWREAMVRRSEPYGELRGGWGDLRYAVSPPDKAGSWFVATVSITPWCTSAWQGLPYEIARPGAAPDRPRILFKGKSTIYLGNDEDLTVEAQQGAFELRHNGSSLDPDLLIRRHVRRYSVAGDSVKRVQPVAESVRDFVDEWIDSPWTEAKGWSGSDPGLAAAHSALRAARFATLGGFASIRSCLGGFTQVEIAGRDVPGWFLRVRGAAAGPWTVEKVERNAAGACAGRDSLRRQIG